MVYWVYSVGHGPAIYASPKGMTLIMSQNDLLSKDYDRFSNLFLKNEEMGEKRMSFFIGLVTAVLSAATFIRSDLRLLLGASVALILFGAATFMRMLQRDRVTNEYKQILDHIRKQILDHIPKQVADKDGTTDHKLPFIDNPVPRLLRGGYAVTTALMNSFIACILAVSLPGRLTWKPTALLVLGVVLCDLAVFRSPRQNTKDSSTGSIPTKALLVLNSLVFLLPLIPILSDWRLRGVTDLISIYLGAFAVHVSFMIRRSG